MMLDHRSFPIEPGYLYEGWIYERVIKLPDLGGPMTHTLLFSKNGDMVAVTNGQNGPGAKLCLRNNKIAICPRELEPFAIGTYHDDHLPLDGT